MVQILIYHARSGVEGFVGYRFELTGFLSSGKDQYL